MHNPQESLGHLRMYCVMSAEQNKESQTESLTVMGVGVVPSRTDPTMFPGHMWIFWKPTGSEDSEYRGY